MSVPWVNSYQIPPKNFAPLEKMTFLGKAKSCNPSQ